MVRVNVTDLLVIRNMAVYQFKMPAFKGHTWFKRFLQRKII